MATAASVSTTWIPEDDFLLKNAVEAGASLEALAKGAVQFSRRFTFRELRDRWHSLLYDPDISAKASARMSELELSGFNPFTKSNRFEQSKGNKEVPQKRKLGSIRKQYYSMRKKFRSEFFNSTDLGFLDGPGVHDRSDHGTDFQDNFELQEGDIEILRSAFLSGCANPVEEKHPNGILRKDEFAEGLSGPLRQDGRPSFDPVMQPRAISSFIKGTPVNFDKHSGVDESGLQQGLEMQHLSVFDSTKDNPQSVFHGLRQGEHLNSPNGNSSFHTIGFPSPQPNLPLWETVEDFSATPLPVILKQGDRIQGADKMLRDDGDGRGEGSLVYNIVPAGTLLGVRNSGPRTNDPPAVSECDDISDSLLNLSNEDDVLLLDVEGKESSDKSNCDNLHSVLLSSPNDVQEDCVSKLELEILTVSETCLAEPKTADIETSEAVADGDHQNVPHPEVEVPSTSMLNSDVHALSNGTMLCTLNTEDPEIPCNDDIFLLIHPSTSFASPAAQPLTRDSMGLSSAANQHQIGEGTNLRTKGKNLARSSGWLPKVGQNMLPEGRRPAHSFLGFGVKSEVPDSDPPISLPVDGNKALPQSSQSRPLHANASTLPGRIFKEDVARVELKTGEAPAAFMEPRTTEAGSSSQIPVPESIANPSMSEEEESQSEDGVPYFSDIEAMILEMDLDPHDQDSCSTHQVSKYQYADSRRSIIRLEQCAQSFLQRAMTTLGAFAIFYGRHLRHYMRKNEVILGRSTDDVDVDIDLREEGRANKISRRQAIIKMEEDGSFHLKNLGKSFVSVNGKSVATGQLLNLSSSCLIEMRGMSFVFEINQKYVRRYICSISQQSTGKDKFDWSPEVDI